MKRVLAGLSLTLLATVTGCGNAAPTASPDSTASSPTATTTAGAPSPTATSQEPSPRVAPATGPLIDGVVVSFHVPPGWTKSPGVVKWQHAALNARLAANVDLTEQPWSHGGPSPQMFDEIVSVTKADADSDTHWRRLPDLTIAGLPFFHLRAHPMGDLAEQYGTIVKQREVVFEFSWLADSSTPAQQRRLTDQMLASVTLK